MLLEAELKLKLALLDTNGLRSKRFGIRSNNRVWQATAGGQLDIFPLGAEESDKQASESLTITDAEKSNLKQNKHRYKRIKIQCQNLHSSH